LYIKGDWLEFSTTLGFVNWKSSDAPCIYCTAKRDEVFEFEKMTALDAGWEEVGAADYENACAVAEVRHLFYCVFVS
jgi:hypothetical protein